ncbi:hypothetical protein H4R24_000933 [Coemansia sp. RSA 988]|nr:hypothetical protein H4R24_000933 [Coemansia sp. RSA 988]
MDHNSARHAFNMAANPGLATPHHLPPPQPQHFHAPNSASARHPQLVTGARAAVPQLELKPNFYNPYHVKHRRRTTKEQLALLEGTFKTTPKPSSEVRKSLAARLRMTAREVQIWFQNRRAKQKNMMLRASSSGARSTADASSPPASTCATTALQSDTLSTSLISALLPASKNSRTVSTDRSAAASAAAVASAPISSSPPMPAPAMRRHSDIPTSFVHNEQRVTSANHLQMPLVSPIDKQAQLLTAPIPRSLPAGVTALAATVPCANTSPLTAMPNPSFVTAAPWSSTSRLNQPKKQKRGNNGDHDRYHTARVHQEAFDGTNKLPVKPEDPTPGSDNHFLDPSNLPNFMMPGAPSSAASVSGFGGMGFNIGSMGLSQQQQPQPLFGGNDIWTIPYGTMPQQQPQMHASATLGAQPQTGLGALCNSLMGVNTNPYSGLALNTFGLASCGDIGSAGASAALSPTDIPFGSDATSSFYQTLFLLSQQGATSAPPLDRPPSLPSPGEAAPLSPANTSTQPRAHGAMYMPTAALPPQMPPLQHMGEVGSISTELFAPVGAQAAATSTTTI